ncbi:hypothetical protein G5I_14382 [Acromyrmex echinatior]|uniref:Uncharacterized protein n=1 Tax=Acromyrmex echinatior TaxID=103372 RepID=F4X7J0_ACREC|nr:hypothetical protein G5I_14382 [Acromyrmex echinatior]
MRLCGYPKTLMIFMQIGGVIRVRFPLEVSFRVKELDDEVIKEIKASSSALNTTDALPYSRQPARIRLEEPAMFEKR